MPNPPPRPSRQGRPPIKPRRPSKLGRPSAPRTHSKMAPPSRAMAYTELPTLDEWKLLTPHGRFGGRANDPFLRQIDVVLNELATAEDGAVLYLLGQIHFTTMAWLQNWTSDPRMDRASRDPVYSLGLYSSNELAEILKCPVNQLDSKLEQIYGVTLTEFGHKKDLESDSIKKYHSAAKREQYKVFFVYGKACHFRKGGKYFRTLDSVRDNVYLQTGFHVDTKTGEKTEVSRTGYGFALSMKNELYVGDFASGNMFHSYFMAGNSVQCAGSMDIVNGIVTRIKNDSGHYKPVDTSLIKVLIYLRMYGVNTRSIEVEEEVSGESTTGHAFMQVNGNWNAIKARRV